MLHLGFFNNRHTEHDLFGATHCSNMPRLTQHKQALLVGSPAARQAAIAGGGIELVLQLLQNNLNTRLAFDASDLLTLLSADSWGHSWGHSQPSSNLTVLQQLVAVTRQLLQAQDALSDNTPNDVAHSSQDGVSASVHLCSEARSPELESVTSNSSQNLMPAAPFSQSVSDPPSRAFVRAASLKLQPGLPPIMTRPDGQHSEAAMPKTPHLPSPEPVAPKEPNASASSGPRPCQNVVGLQPLHSLHPLGQHACSPPKCFDLTEVTTSVRCN